MRKVFFDKKLILVSSKKSFRLKKKAAIFSIEFVSKRDITKALNKRNIDLIYIYHSNEDRVWHLFTKMFPVVEAAGGLVKNSVTGRVLFIYRKSKWDLPKGKVEKKEVVEAAAIREVAEETGVKEIKIIKSLGSTYHIFRKAGKYQLKNTHWFMMRSSSQAELVPQKKEGIKNAIWVSVDEVSFLLEKAYENIKLVFKKKKVIKEIKLEK